jgi:hypothetical protein
VAEGATLSLRSAEYRFTGASAMTGDGLVRFEVPILAPTVTLAAGAELLLDLPTAGLLTLGGTLNADGSVINTGQVNWQGMTLNLVGGLTNRGTWEMGAAGGRTISGTFINEGTVRHTTTSSVNVPAGTIINQAGGLYEFTVDGGFSDPAGTGGGFQNFGTLLKSGGTGTSNMNLVVTNSGLVDLRSGTMSFLKGLTQTMGTLRLNGGNVAGSAVDLQGGLLTGFGSIAASVVNAATIEVAGSGAAGSLQITRPYTQTSAGVLNIELGGTDPLLFDRLLLTSNMTLAGTLNVRLIDGFAPAEGHSFDIITFGTRIDNSQFEIVTLPDELATIIYDNVTRRVTVR